MKMYINYMKIIPVLYTHNIFRINLTTPVKGLAPLKFLRYDTISIFP